MKSYLFSVPVALSIWIENFRSHARPGGKSWRQNDADAQKEADIEAEQILAASSPWLHPP